jgi:hypothetical protein
MKFNFAQAVRGMGEQLSLERAQEMGGGESSKLTCAGTALDSKSEKQGAKQMHIERMCDCELPRQSCRLGRACLDFFDSDPALVLFGTSAQRTCEGRWDL